MPRPRSTNRLRTPSQTDSWVSREPNDDGAGRGKPRSEDVRIRSYDRRRSYDLDVEVVAAAGRGRSLLHRRYVVEPGATMCEVDLLPAGEYEVHVTLDNAHHDVLRCRIDDRPAHTAVIEVGNGVVSLTDGPSD
jgi:hypothetical protein